MSVSPDVRARCRAAFEELADEYLGDGLESGESFAELFGRIDALERRLRLETEIHLRPDGLVDWVAVLAAVREWMRNPGSEG